MSAKTKTGDAPRAYLLRGDDDFQKHQDLEKLLKILVAPDFADFDLEQAEGNTATCDRIMAGLGVPPFGSERRVVLVKYANKMDSAEQEKLAERLAKMPASGCLVVVNPAAEKADGKPKKGTEIIGNLSKAIRKIGEVREYGPEKGLGKGDKAREFARSLFATARKKIEPDVLAAFLQRVGGDFAIINSEARKLIDYSDPSDRITAADVAAVTSETPEEKVFKMVEAVAAKNQAAALRLLDELFETGDDPRSDAPKTLGTLARQFRLLWQMKFLSERGVRSYSKSSVPEEIRSMLPGDPNILDLLSRQAWQAKRLEPQARLFSRAELARCFGAIARADLMLKGVEGDVDDPKLVMELLVIDLARGGPAGR